VLDSASVFSERALEAATALYGERHVEVAAAWGRLAGAYYYQGEWASAEEAGREALARVLFLYDEEHIEVTGARLNLGITLAQQERFAEAEEFFRNALTPARKLLPADHDFIKSALAQLGRALVRQGEHQAAEEIASEALGLMRNEDPVSVAGRLATAVRGEALLGLRRHAEAETLLLESLDAYQDDSQFGAPGMRRDVRAALARLYDALGQQEESDRYRRMQHEEDENQSQPPPNPSRGELP
jgi:tetratricopeptide (TPR) repeat protein